MSAKSPTDLLNDSLKILWLLATNESAPSRDRVEAAVALGGLAVQVLNDQRFRPEPAADPAPAPKKARAKKEPA